MRSSDTLSCPLIMRPGYTATSHTSDAITQVCIGSGLELIVVEQDGAIDLTQALSGTPAGLYKQKFTTAGRRLVVYCRQDPR